MTKWYEECRKKGVRPNTLEISKKAIEISSIEEFKGSKGWVSKFLDYMKRNGANLDDDKSYGKSKDNTGHKDFKVNDDVVNINEIEQDDEIRIDLKTN